MNTECSIPVRFDAVAMVRKEPRLIRTTEFLDVEIPTLSHSDAFFHDLPGMRNRSVAVVDGKAFIPVDFLRHPKDMNGTPIDDGFLQSITYMSAKQPFVPLGPFPPFDADELGYGRRLNATRMKRLFAERGKYELVDTTGRDLSMAIAARDAADLAFIEGTLHTARFEMNPMMLLSSEQTPARKWHCSFREKRSSPSAIDHVGFIEVRPDRAHDVASILGLPDPRESWDDNVLEFFEMTKAREFRDFDRALTKLIQTRIGAIDASQNFTSLVEPGDGRQPIPEELDRHVLAGRRIIRRLEPLLAIGDSIDTEIDDVMSWLEDGEDLVTSLGRRIVDGSRLEMAFDPMFRAGMQSWLANIERPMRKIEHQTRIPDEDFEAIGGLRV